MKQYKNNNLNVKVSSILDYQDYFNTISDNSQLFILCDENTKQCVNYLINNISALLNAEIIQIKSGEQNKNIETVSEIWKILSNNKARRDAIFINVGGGVITDLGGFAASTYKRGISFINIPTSLLAMTDASVGGKTGIDLDNIKNQIGVFSLAELVICDSYFLNTLNKNEFRSGFAEVIKHALIYDKDYWLYCSSKSIQELDIDFIIKESIRIKSDIVIKDPKEKNLRKILNLGHTTGHALETYKLDKNPILHGDAVAAGIIIESYISMQINLLSESEFDEIQGFILNTFPKIEIDKDVIPILLNLMQNDKKNNSNGINFTLLSSIGKAEINKYVDESIIEKAISYYIEIS